MRRARAMVGLLAVLVVAAAFVLAVGGFGGNPFGRRSPQSGTETPAEPSPSSERSTGGSAEMETATADQDRASPVIVDQPALPLLERPEDTAVLHEETDTTASPRPGHAQSVPVDQPQFSQREEVALPASELAAVLSKSATLIAQQKPIEAHRLLSKLCWRGGLSTAQKAEVLAKLEPLSRALFFSAAAPNLEAHYTIQPGDSLQRLAPQWQISWQYLQSLNGIGDPRRIRPGQRLKIIRGPFEALIDLSDFEATIILDGLWVKRYPVGIGKDNRTPLGTFLVRNKVENPPYAGPEGQFRPEDPKNPVGERWIDLGDGYGIHGTIEPETVGKKTSRGCIRMLPEDVAEGYSLLVVGSRVHIRQ